MNLKKNSLTIKIWLYLIVFSVAILAFLWFFQIIFLNTYYEWVKTRSINEIANKAESIYQNGNYEEALDNLSYDRGLCIELFQNNVLSYTSNNFNRGCMMGMENHPAIQSYRQDFLKSGLKSKTYQIINPKFNNKTLVKAIHLEENAYLFINASLEPLDSTAWILKDQLIYVTIIVLGLSFVIAYFISRKISQPIVKISGAAKKMAKGEYDVVFETGEDIAEMNELTTTLNYARDELAKTDELRRDLMANVSHDLKTPLTMIKAYAEMVRDLTYQNEEKRTAHLNTIIEETDRLNLLVNDILDLSSMQSSINQLYYESFDLKKLIETILKRYAILVETEKYEFQLDCPESVLVYADQKRITQVIYNLINNAINYVGKDNVIQIQVTEGEVVQVEIIDHGKGILEKDLPHIWEKYYKSEKKHKRNVIGTGLGLSIVKTILENHHVSYGVKSSKRGTTFYFELPKSE